MKKILAVIMVVMMLTVLFVGCGGKSAGMYKDGTYYVKGDPDQQGNFADIRIEVKDGQIVMAVWKEYTKDGKEKDGNYGKGTDQTNYNKAQAALSASRNYGSILQSVQDVEKVDAISGATNSHKLFKKLANQALERAKN